MKKKDTKTLIPIKFDLSTLDLLCKFSIDKKPYITRKHLTMLRDLTMNIDDTKYKLEPNLMARLIFIKRALTSKLIENMTNEKAIISYAVDDATYRSIMEEQVLPELDETILNGADIDYIIKIITENVKYGFLYNYIPELSQVIEDSYGEGYLNISEINNRFEIIMSKLMNDMRKVKSLDSANKIFDLNNDTLKETMSDVIDELKKPESSLITGYKRLNEMLCGGFAKGRIYCFLGSTGGFKSGLLINLLKSLKINNTYKPKDLSKKPMILYVTQENSIKESVQRLFATISNENLKSLSPDQAIDRLKEGGLDLDSNGINIRMIFKQGGTVNTSVFYDLAADLDTEGYEIIAILHDYVKTMKPVDNHPEIRIAMTNVVREMKYVAVNLDIPVITAAQLNREAAKTIDSAAGTSKVDITRQIGRSNVGESWSMIEELDFGAIVNREFHEQHNRDYLVIKGVKHRYGHPKFLYFAQPFAMDNTFKLEEDEFLEKPLSVLSMQANYDDIDSLVGGKKKSAKTRPSVNDQHQFTEDVSNDFASFLKSVS